MPYKERDINKLYYTMGEVTEMFDVNASQIRFYEREFEILQPKKNKKGNRLFTPDDELAQQLLAAGQQSGDKLWRMPLGETFDRLIDSPVADMKNVGPREGGSITAAEFIHRFVDEGVRWAHLDIAGMAWSDKATATFDKGATGYGVRLLDQFVADTLEA